jgi:hypothetical protein
MKFNSVLVEQAVTQLGAEPIPDQHPAIPQLNQVFGEHKFFLDPNRLHIVEPDAPNEAGEQTGKVVKVAGWSDAQRTSLSPQPPEPTGIVIVLAPDKPDSAG